jgi:uncharacterized membrane protein
VTLFEALKAYDQLKAAGTSIRVIDLTPSRRSIGTASSRLVAPRRDG